MTPCSYRQLVCIGLVGMLLTRLCPPIEGGNVLLGNQRVQNQRVLDILAVQQGALLGEKYCFYIDNNEENVTNNITELKKRVRVYNQIGRGESWDPGYLDGYPILMGG